MTPHLSISGSWFCWQRGVSSGEGGCLGLQRRDIIWHEDGTATLYVHRQLNANTGDLTMPKTEADKRPLSVPDIMLHRVRKHLEDNVAPRGESTRGANNTAGECPVVEYPMGIYMGRSP